ncbi:MAG: hypothetical protein AAF911_10345 [Planctomycetota bacterium]
MPVYLFTYHTYRSWMPDHPRGYTKRKRGVLPSDPVMARRYAGRAKFERVLWDEADREVALRAVARVCEHPDREDWRLHEAVAVFNHLHVVVSWEGKDAASSLGEEARVADTAARGASKVLHRAITVDVRDSRGWEAGRAVLSRGGDRKRVRDKRHLKYLVEVYLPRHKRYGGVLWSEMG